MAGLGRDRWPDWPWIRIRSSALPPSSPPRPGACQQEDTKEQFSLMLLKKVQAQGAARSEARGVVSRVPILMGASQRRGSNATPQMGLFQHPASSSSALPIPRITHKSGSAASRASGPVSWLSCGAMPRRNPPPPARTIPLSDRSALGSGGAHSSGIWTTSLRAASGSSWSVAMRLWPSARRRFSTCARRYKRTRSGTHRSLARRRRSRVPGRERA